MGCREKREREADIERVRKERQPESEIERETVRGRSKKL